MGKKYLFTLTTLFLILGGFQSLKSDEISGYSTYPRIKAGADNTVTAMAKGGVNHEENILWSYVLQKPKAEWLKIHFADFQIGRQDFLELKDRNGTLVATIKGCDVEEDQTSIYKVIKKEGKSNFWIHAIEGNTVTIELKSKNKRKANWGFTIDEVGVGTRPLNGTSVVQDIIGTDNLQQIYCYYNQQPYLRGRSVGWMHFKDNGVWYNGKIGFLLSCNNTNHFLTHSDHMGDQLFVESLEVRFDYFYTSCSGQTSIPYAAYSGDHLIDYNPGQGARYSLLTLKGNPQSTYTPLIPSNQAPYAWQPIYVLQFPAQTPLKVAFGFVYYVGWWFYHFADVEPNNHIGAPILEDNPQSTNKVIGIADIGPGTFSNISVKMSDIYAKVAGYLQCQQ
ncbi:MAG: hypothetical protein ACM3SY_09095 [Candidatus Omnitrophota bacterium]